jgi:hypothetical protein
MSRMGMEIWNMSGLLLELRLTFMTVFGLGLALPHTRATAPHPVPAIAWGLVQTEMFNQKQITAL